MDQLQDERRYGCVEECLQGFWPLQQNGEGLEQGEDHEVCSGHGHSDWEWNIYAGDDTDTNVGAAGNA